MFSYNQSTYCGIDACVWCDNGDGDERAFSVPFPPAQTASSNNAESADSQTEKVCFKCLINDVMVKRMMCPFRVYFFFVTRITHP